MNGKTLSAIFLRNITPFLIKNKYFFVLGIGAAQETVATVYPIWLWLRRTDCNKGALTITEASKEK